LGALGIELGARHARVASVTEAGMRVTAMPSVVCAFRGRPMIGTSAEQIALRTGARAWPLERLLDGGGLDVDGKKVSVESLAGVLAHRLIDAAKRELGVTAERAVLAVSPAATNEARSRWRTAVASVGVHVDAVVLEPSAIAVAVALGHTRKGLVAVVDVGADGAAVAIFDVAERRLRLVSCCAAPNAGGNRIDDGLCDKLRMQLGDRAAKLQADTAAAGAFRRACEAMKRRLVLEPTVAQRVEIFPGEPAASLRLDRAQLADAVAPVRTLMENACLEAIADASLGQRALSAVYFHGGGAHVADLVVAVGRAFGRPPLVVADQVPAVAYGAAVLAAASGVELDEKAAAAPAEDASRSSRPSWVESGTRSAGIHESGDHARAGQESRAHESGDHRRSSRPPVPSSRRDALLARGGHIVNATDPAAILALAVTRPLRDTDLEPVALPVLLLRVLGRTTATGTLCVRPAGGGEELPLLVVSGRAYQNENERAALRAAFAWPQATYVFHATPPDVGERRATSMARVAADGLRSVLRGLPLEALSAALQDRMALAPTVREERRVIVEHLQLDTWERRLLKMWLDGSADVERIVSHGGIGKHTALGLVVLLATFDCLAWQQPRSEAKKSLAEELEERARTIEEAPLFAALGLHWSAPEAEIEQAYRKLRAELAPGTPAHQAAPDACARLLRRARAAHDVLKDPALRARHRRESAPALDFDSIEQLLEKRAEALAMKKDTRGEEETEAVRKEIKRSRKPE
jgi:hypothetical protein